MASGCKDDGEKVNQPPHAHDDQKRNPDQDWCGHAADDGEQGHHDTRTDLIEISAVNAKQPEKEPQDKCDDH